MSARSASSNDISMDRHRSPSATQIYSSARSYLSKNGDGQILQAIDHGQLLEHHENQDKANVSSKIQSSPDALQMKKIKQKAKAEKLKRSTRKRSSSVESEIPKPVISERARSTEIFGGIARTELERSKTESAMKCGDSGLDYVSDIDEASSIKPNTERAKLAQAAASSTRLMSISLGRGQSIPSSSQAAAMIAAEQQQQQTGQSNGKLGASEDGSASEMTGHPSIEYYIGQTFPHVKSIDKPIFEIADVESVESSVGSTGTANVAALDLQSSADQTNLSHSQEQKGKRSYRQKKGFRSAVDTAGIIAVASETTKTNLAHEALPKGALVTPPRKGGKNLLDGFDHNLRSAPGSRSGSPMVDSEKIEQGISRSAGPSKLRESTSAPSSTSSQAPSRALGNDQLLHQRLQEAKALGRKGDSSNGAVMHKFSLWKGVEKRAPLVNSGGSGSAVAVPGSSTADISRKPSADSSPTDPMIAPPKKSSKLKRGPRPTLQASEEAMVEASSTSAPVRLAKIRHHKSPSPPETLSQQPPKQASTPVSSTPPHQQALKPSIEYTTPTRVEFDLTSDGDSADEVSSGDEGGVTMSGGGRASAFRNMVGICKAHNASAGSMTESVQTDMGPNVFLATAGSNSVDTLYSDDEEFEYSPHREDEAAILGIAVDDCSILSEEDYGGEVDKASSVEEAARPIMTREKLKSHHLSPESSSSSLAYSHSHDNVKAIVRAPKKELVIDSFDTVENVSRIPAFSPVAALDIAPDEPPPLRKGEKPTHLFQVDQLPTEIGGEPSSRLPTERRTNYFGRENNSSYSKSSESDRKKKHNHRSKKSKQAQTEAERTFDTSVNRHSETGREDSPSPTLSEVSEIDPENEMEPFNIASMSKTAPPTSTPSSMPQYSQQQEEIIYTIKDFQWKIGSEIIGEGTFGQVFKGMNCSTGELLAVKQICLTDGTAEEVRTLRKEIDLMQDLNHPNIVRYVGTSVSSRYLFIVLEYVPGGCVAGMLSQFGAFSEILIRRLVSQVMQGVDYLHQKGIIHRDIKGGNILVSDTGVAKLADFGCSKQLAGLCTTSLEESMRTIRGSVPWMAPEVIKQEGHGRSADIWSVGATIIEMATAKHPWPEFSNNLAALFHVATSKDPPPIPDRLSLDCANFMRRCMTINPKERATAKELLSDPFLLALIVTTT